jgi:hypothetical protein
MDNYQLSGSNISSLPPTPPKKKIKIKFLTLETGKNCTSLEANIYGKSFLKL